MKTHLPTFSSLGIRFACEATDVLGRVQEEDVFSLAGDARHSFFARISETMQADPPLTLEAAREVSLACADPADRRALEAIPLEALARLGLDSVAVEVALAYDVQTGECRELGRDLGRKYDEAGRLPSEIVGATDRLSLIGTDGLYIGDYKGRAHRTHPAEDPQFLAAALCGTRIHNRKWAEIEVIRNVDGELFHAATTVSRLQLDTFELELQDLAARITQNRAAYRESGGLDIPEATEGAHCRYCPSYRYCPAKGAIARATLGGDSESLAQLVKAGTALITPENAPKLRRLAKEGKRILELLEEGLRDFARQTPFQQEDGKWYGVPPDAQERELLDGAKVQAVLAELFGEEPAKAAAKVSVTFEGIERAVRAFRGDQLARGDLKKYADQAEELLLKRGLLRVIQGGQVKAYTVKEDKPPKEPKTPKVKKSKPATPPPEVA